MVRRAAHFGKRLDHLGGFLAHRGGRCAQPLENSRNNALRLLDQGEQEVYRLHLLVAIAPGDFLRRLERFLRFYCEFVKSCSHVGILCFQRLALSFQLSALSQCTCHSLIFG